MAASTTSTEAELIAEYWNNVFLSNLRENLLFWRFGMKSTHGRGQGTMAHWIGLYDMTASGSLTEGTDPNEHTLSAQDQTATVSQYGGSVLISDLLQQTMLPGSYEQMLANLARNASLTIDTVIRDGVFTAGGSAQYAGTAVARNSIATDGSFDADITEIREAVNSLESNKAAPFPDGRYAGIIHPDVKYDLQGDTAQWAEILKHTPQGFAQFRDAAVGASRGEGVGAVGEMYGVKFYMTTQALVLDGEGSASTDVYQSYIFGPEHFGVSQLQDVQTIIKNPHPASDLDLYGSIGWKVAFAYKELNSARMVRLESGASLGD